MARIARVVIPHCPHHVTHRGNRGEPIFFAAEHRDLYRCWLREEAEDHGLAIWAYSLMTSHIHLIVVPECEESLELAIGHAHGRYAQWLNERLGQDGHLWGDRYYSVPMDEPHLWSATRYVESNPVRAGIVLRAEDYAWSSAAAHGFGYPDALLSPDRPFPDARVVGNWAEWLSEGVAERELEAIRRHTSTGRPLGSREFVKRLEEQTGRILAEKRSGRKRRYP